MLRPLLLALTVCLPIAGCGSKAAKGPPEPAAASQLLADPVANRIPSQMDSQLWVDEHVLVPVEHTTDAVARIRHAQDPGKRARLLPFDKGHTHAHPACRGLRRSHEQCARRQTPS